MTTQEDARAAMSRAISDIDLNKALKEVQNRPQPSLRYSPESLLSLRPAKSNGECVEVSEVGSPLADGVMTPPFSACPNPPPPTPATPSNASNVTSGDEGGKENKNTIPGINLPSVIAGPEKKKKSGKNKKHVTGFEVFYCDPPITPEEHEEECDVYDVSVPFERRIQTCIQRYRTRRNLDEVRSNILTKYFMLGGIESTTKAFTGGALDQETLDNATAAEIAALQATDFVRPSGGNAKYYDGSDKWVVDFEGVAKGFFSYRVPNMFSMVKESEIVLYAMVVRNFLNYVLHHQVCEEYTHDVMAARKICDLAEKELWAIRQLQVKMPGDFNTAASTLYGGRYQGAHMGNAAWAVDQPEYDYWGKIDQGFTVPEAERIFKTAIAFAGNDEMFLKVMAEDVQIVKSTAECFEVIAIERPDLKTIEEYANVKNFKGEPGFIKALGVLKLKRWEGPKIVPEDFTDDEGDDDTLVEEEDVESFWLEDDLLQICYVGLKLELMVHELNIGVKFFDSILGLYCSFFTALPNEKMVLWKEPGMSSLAKQTESVLLTLCAVPNTRLPPTVDDPEVEQRALEVAMEKELDADDKLLSDEK